MVPPSCVTFHPLCELSSIKILLALTPTPESQVISLLQSTIGQPFCQSMAIKLGIKQTWRLLAFPLFPSPGHIPDPGIKPVSSASPALAGRFFIAKPPGKPSNTWYKVSYSKKERKRKQQPKVIKSNFNSQLDPLKTIKRDSIYNPFSENLLFLSHSCWLPISPTPELSLHSLSTLS